MDYNLYHEDMLTSHYRIRDYNVFLERKLSKSSYKKQLEKVSMILHSFQVCLMFFIFLDFHHFVMVEYCKGKNDV